MRSRAALVSLLFCCALPVLGAPFTPLEWQGEIQRSGDRDVVIGKLVTWNRDVDHNFIDDLLDGRAPSDKVGIIVDFNRCVTCCDKGTEHEVITYLRTVGTVDFVSSLVTFAVVLDVPVSELPVIANRKEVAMVEYLVPAGGTLNISNPAVRVGASSAFSPFTVQDVYPSINGQGTTIAILDSGVDNVGSGPGTKNEMFPAGTFIGGANCITNPCTITDPDDDNGHGTHIAGIALGRPIACPGGTCRGMAPAANLVDIKVFNNGSCEGSSCFRGLELAIQKREEWGIDVINMSIGNCEDSNGVNSAAQLINMAVSFGLTTVVAGGNTCGLGDVTQRINDWAAASLAVTVAAVDDGNSVSLSNDVLADYSLHGPRLSDHDIDVRDELKPEIAAPGSGIVSACNDSQTGTVSMDGTSMAAPHVAGVVALIKQRFPDINPGSLKEVLIGTAAQSKKPGPHPGYDPGWGFGFLDAFAAVDHGPINDIGRPSEPPYFPCGAGWCSPYISTATPLHIGVANEIRVQIRNFSAFGVGSARVCFGVYTLSNNFNHFFELGCVPANLPGNTTTVVPFPWTPTRALLPPGHVILPENFPITPIHACIKVSIDYPWDTNFANNEMQRNVTITQVPANTPNAIAEVPFRLENNSPEEKQIALQVETKSDWQTHVMFDGKPVEPPVFTMEPKSCPKDLIIRIEPPKGAKKGDAATFILRAVENGHDFGGAVVDVEVSEGKE